MILERPPLDLMEVQWFPMEAKHLAKQSVVFDFFNGWKATIGVNGIAMVFAETTIGLDGIGMVFIAAIDNEPSARFSDHTSPQ